MTLIVCFTCAVTTQQAFAEADLNHDGKLSYAEFTKWYMASNSSSELVRDADKIKKYQGFVTPRQPLWYGRR